MELAWIYATMNEIRIWSLRSLAGAGKHSWLQVNRDLGRRGYKDGNFKSVLVTFSLKL